MPDIEFTVNSNILPEIPYKLGEILLDYYNIKLSDELFFILIDLCLNSIQAPTTFLNSLKELSCLKEEITKDKLINIVEKIDANCFFPLKTALDNIIPDIEIWASDEKRKYLGEALKWYLSVIQSAIKLRTNFSPTFFSLPFIMDYENFVLLHKTYPPPILIKGNQFYSLTDIDNVEVAESYDKNFECASTIWFHRVLYNLLTIKDITQLRTRLSTDSLVTSAKCSIIEYCKLKEEIDDEYTCITAPWEIINNSKEIVCPYGAAAHSFGLWQNKLDIKLEE